MKKLTTTSRDMLEGRMTIIDTEPQMPTKTARNWLIRFSIMFAAIGFMWGVVAAPHLGGTC